MKTYLASFFMVVFAACSSSSGKPKSIKADQYPVHKLPGNYKTRNQLRESNKADTLEINQRADAFANYYIVIADTGNDYYSLRAKMINLKNSMGIPIDTLGRYYDKSKDLIALPDSDDDEIYAGDYFPRREPSANLSLEYMNYYKPGSKKKTIALVAGIYEDKTSADSLLKSISSQNGAFDLKARIYIGCMH